MRFSYANATTTSLPSLVISRSFGPTAVKSSIAWRSSNALRTSATVALRSCPPELIAATAFLIAKNSRYAGTIFIPMIARKTMPTRITNTPAKPIPRCLFICGRLPLVERAEPAQLAEVEPDEERLAHDVLVGNEPPHPAVGRVVAVVPHHEVMARRYCAGESVIIVGAILSERELLHEGNRGGRVVLHEDAVGVVAYPLEVLLGVRRALVEVLPVGLQLEFLAVDPEPLPHVVDPVPGDADD